MGDQTKYDLADITPAPRSPQSLQSYRFSPDELRVLNQCNHESFFERSLPIGTVFGLSTFAAIRNGYLKQSVRFGPFPKVSLAVVAGYFIGKFSYQQKCAEKLMALPGSYIGQLLRDRRDGKITTKQLPSVPLFGATGGDIYSDAGPGSALNLDTDRPSFDEDNYQPGSSQTQSSDHPSMLPPLYSYEDMRKNNRQAYTGTRQDPSTFPPITQPSSPIPSSASTNQYGDVVE